jgi:uncharacterized membrane protein HdeD (DUF308 family)
LTLRLFEVILVRKRASFKTSQRCPVSDGTRRKIAILEIILASIAGLLAVITVFWDDWIEAITGWDPDHYDGSAERTIVVALALVAIALAVAARFTWVRLRSAASPT